MTRPTPQTALYAWHSNAMLGILGEDHPMTDEPHCGWFMRKLVKHGVMVPARIRMVQPTDENGDLVGDEALQCEVMGKPADPETQWQWLCVNPISEADFNYRTATMQWSAEHAPHEPMANPHQRVDWMKVPTPTFENKEAAS